jgi:hypothetical protein
MKDVLPSTHEYIVPPLTKEQQQEQASKQMMAFLATRPGSEAYLKE